MRLYLHNDLIKAANTTAITKPKAPKTAGSIAAPTPKPAGTNVQAQPHETGRPSGAKTTNPQAKDYYPKSEYPERPINAIDESPSSWILPKGVSPQYADTGKPTEKPGAQKPGQAQVPQEEVPATPEQQQEASQGNSDPYSPNPQGPPPQDPAQQASAQVAQQTMDVQTGEYKETEVAAPGEVVQRAAARKKAIKDKLKQEKETPKGSSEAAIADAEQAVKWAQNPEDRTISAASLHAHMLGQKGETKEHSAKISEAIKDKIHDLSDDELAHELTKLEGHDNPHSNKIAKLVREKLKERETKPRPMTQDELKEESFKEQFQPGYRREKLGLGKLESEAKESAKKKFKEASEQHSEAMASNEAKVKEYTDAKNKQNKERDELTSKLQSLSERVKTLKDKHKSALDEVHSAAVKEVEDKISEHKGKLDSALKDHNEKLDKLQAGHDALSERYKLTGDKNLMPAIKNKKEEIAAQKNEITETKAKANKDISKLNAELTATRKDKKKAASDPKVKAVEKELSDAENEHKETSSALAANKKQKIEKPELADVSDIERSPKTPHEKQMNAAHKADAKGLADNIESHLIHNEDVQTDSAKQKEAKQLLKDLHEHANYEGVPTKQHTQELKMLQRRAKQLGMDKTHAGAATAAGKGAKGTGASSSGAKTAEAVQPGQKPSNPMEHAKVDSHRRKAHTMIENAKTHLKYDKNMDPNTRKYLESAIAEGGPLHRAANSTTIPTKEEENELREQSKDLRTFSGKPHEDSKPKKEKVTKEGKSKTVQSFKTGMSAGAHITETSATSEGGGKMAGGAARGIASGVVSGGHKLLNAARKRSEDKKKAKEEKEGEYEPTKYSYTPDDEDSTSTPSSGQTKGKPSKTSTKTKDMSGQESEVPEAPPPIKEPEKKKESPKDEYTYTHGYPGKKAAQYRIEHARKNIAKQKQAIDDAKSVREAKAANTQKTAKPAFRKSFSNKLVTSSAILKLQSMSHTLNS